MGNMVQILRISLGDYGFLALTLDLDDVDNYTLYVIFLVFVVTMSIIFLNFLIAEASASYEAVASNLEQYIFQDRARLIAES